MENKNELFYQKQNIFQTSDKTQLEEIDAFAKDYIDFLNSSKTEREGCREIVKRAKQQGYSAFEFGQKLKAGDKKFYVNRDKSVVLFKIGKENLEEKGIKIIASHLDSPRLDLKPNPMYEDEGFCFFKTHYYGGIKKYQWAVVPLALHGTAILANGKKMEFVIGENEDEPVFYISDLLPHLGTQQMEKKAKEVLTGEQLNIIIGGKAETSSKVKDKIKENILKILNKKYGVVEEDFLSSEISAVPAFKAREVGFDRAFIAGYGHDDRSCSYANLQAFFDSDLDQTCMAIFVDKEEIGSEGDTGAQNKLFEDLISELCENFKAKPRVVRVKSKAISADVTSCYDPNFASVFDKNNVAKISCGTCVCKYDGSRGKSGSNDASAELMGEIRQILAQNNIQWQTGELGIVDLGGGGTISAFIAKLNIDTIDIGLPVLSMHAPCELISKADLHSTYSAYKAFFSHKR